MDCCWPLLLSIFLLKMHSRTVFETGLHVCVSRTQEFSKGRSVPFLVHGWNFSIWWRNSAFWKPPNKEILILNPPPPPPPPLPHTKKNHSFSDTSFAECVPVQLFLKSEAAATVDPQVNSTLLHFCLMGARRALNFAVKNEKLVFGQKISHLHLTCALSTPGPRLGFLYSELSEVSALLAYPSLLLLLEGTFPP